MFYCRKKNVSNNSKEQGFSLIETLIGVAVFLIIALSIYGGFLTVSRAVEQSRDKISATALVNERMEIIRNLPYVDVGVIGGIPDGKIPYEQTTVRNGKEYEITTTIRNIDSPFDGVFPVDTSPADYKLVEIEINCLNCRNFQPLSFNTHIGSGGLETTSENGALFVQVFDAVGQPVVGADVYIENNKATSTIVINDVTDIDGFLKIVDAPPGFEAYEVEVSKDGYSTERTYPNDLPEIINPTKLHATVVLQTLTQLSFSIDKLSKLNVITSTDLCNVISNRDFDLFGSKVLGTSPDVLKYDESKNTGITGELEIPDLEWDTYDIRFSDSSYNLAGTIPSLPVSLDPDTEQDLRIVLEPKVDNAILVSVKDAGSQLPLSGVEVVLENSSGFNETKTTGRGFLTQSDWSGGSGQEDFVDSQRYLESSNVNVLESIGEIKLTELFPGQYVASGSLTSSTFDTGSSSSFHRVFWLPQNQAVETGTSSVLVQIASNNDDQTWNFLGPDGTDQTFYTSSNQNINSVHDGDRYYRYKIFLSTEDITRTPIISDISVTFTTECVPPGQVLFSGLSLGDYELTISRDGYSEFNETFSISSSWQKKEISLSP